ncbi:formylglycine-generating enzyme family protein [Dyella monticola]|uniref:Formylglycine-generating enzyme family protein n=1 Tax=Dyella monticola TaxID=1927958 RepID=A0A370WXK9_9GAMM|nr:SUMF1/EgtB/PvdO family nonheme iron enzyme [Dyella monticola]RDS80879.1 formylglycine-generating enzyme family protein [Dyella monticola]
MPSKETVQRQRALGGALGVLVLAFGLTYHFFPELFHVSPEEVANPVAPGAGRAAPSAPVRTPTAVPSEQDELNAGPPLTLAPTAVIAARLTRKPAALPEQMSADPPEVRDLVERADKAFQAGRVVGDQRSAAALYQQALKLKPDSRAAAQGLDQVRTHLIAQITQDIAVGDSESAGTLLDSLKALPNTAADVAPLEANMKTLLQVRPMLAQAASLLQQGKADKPAGNDALDLYRQVQQLDPQNAVAAQGILQVQRVMLDRALAAVAQNDFTGAQQAIAEATPIQPDSPQLKDVSGQIDAIRQQRAAGILAQARSALDAGNIALAKQLAGQAQSISPQLTGLDEFEQRLTNARLYASFKPGQVFSDRFVDMNGQSPTMVVVPTGNFMMGAPDNEQGHTDAQTPQHEVTISKGFALSQTDITVGQFREFVRASGYKPESVTQGGASVYDERTGVMRDVSNATWADDYAGHPATDNLPVVNISWNDANAYVQWLSQRTGKKYRLPSESEFEYALRAGSTSRYWWGDGTPKSKVENLTGSLDRSPSGRRWSHAFYNYGDGYWGPSPVMTFAPNAFGLYDMDGNVSEWMSDCWHDNYVRAPVDGTAWINPGCITRVVRGGSWGSSPEQANSAYRQGADASIRSGRVGFRILREL